MNFGLLGFACDEGVRRNNGRVGASLGPKSFREALKKINWHTHEKPPFIDFGDVTCHDGDLEFAQQELSKKVLTLLQSQQKSLVIGGGHETAFGHFCGLSKYLGVKNIGIINFDAHFDLRPVLENNLGTSGTPFLQIAHERKAKNLEFDYLVLGIQPFSNSDSLFKTAQDLKVTSVLAENLEQEAPVQIKAMLERHEFIYLSICLDVFAESAAPGVSAPQALGLLPSQILPLLKQIKHSQKVIGLDIVELAPAYDRQDTTAKLAASLAAYWLHAL
jgi:formiminoglutamase